MNADLELVLAKAAATPTGQLKAAFVAGDLAKIAPLFANPATRAHAEAMLQVWAQSPDPLRKGMASAWLSTARDAIHPAVAGALQFAQKAGGEAADAAGRVAAHPTVQAAATAVQDGAQRAGKTAFRGYARAENAVGNAGAAAGRAYAGSGVARRSRLEAEQFGGRAARTERSHRIDNNARFDAMEASADARSRMADRLRGRHEMRDATSRQTTNRVDTQRSLIRGAGDSAAAGVMAQHAAVRPQALSDAYARGRAQAASEFTGHAAAHGRMAARYAFRAGLALAGTAAAAHTLGGSSPAGASSGTKAGDAASRAASGRRGAG